MTSEAVAFWVVEPGTGELRTEALPRRGEDDVLVRACCSAVSRGTERLVFTGRVPADQHQRMRAPFQVGEFPGPVKYGYLSVGVVEAGPPALVDRTVFCLYPHQSHYVVPADAVTVVPPAVPPERAVLTGTVETAVTALWDEPPRLGDRVGVVGAGLVGCCLARLLARMPGVETTLVDVDPARATTAAALGVGFALPADAPGELDVVFHTSATDAGLRTSLAMLATDGTVVELSWYGDAEVGLPLGGDFHSRRLAVRASQVGRIPPGARPRWTSPGRRALALELLADPAFDHLVTGRSPLEELPDVMGRLAAGSLDGICHLVTYPGGAACSP